MNGMSQFSVPQFRPECRSDRKVIRGEFLLLIRSEDTRQVLIEAAVDMHEAWEGQHVEEFAEDDNDCDCAGRGTASLYVQTPSEDAND